jgi:hypothetical protein
MKTFLIALVTFVAVLPLQPSAKAQVPAKTADIIQEIGPDGSINLTFQMSFDAGPWKIWKTIVGDEPSRLRAMMRHQFAAFVIDDFKLEKDDMNRTAKMTMRSPAGPELRKDQRFQISVEGWCRLVNHTGREWFFSGNNPSAGNSLNTIKIIMPANTVEATLVNPGTAEQTLVYSLRQPAGKSRIVLWSGAVIMVLGASMLTVGFLPKKHPGALPLRGLARISSLPGVSAQERPALQAQVHQTGKSDA